MRPVYVGAPSGDCDVAPPVERGKDQEQIAHTVTFIFIVLAWRLARLARQGLPSFFDLWLARFIHTHQGTGGCIRATIDCKRLLHGTNAVGMGLGWNTPLFFQPRFQRSFFNVRRTVSSEMAATTWSATNLSA
jgi:hypothetical protein